MNIKTYLRNLWEKLLIGHHKSIYMDLFAKGIISFKEYLEWEKRGP